MPEESQLYLNCKRCFEKKPKHMSMMNYARLNVFTDGEWVMVECVRCKLPVLGKGFARLATPEVRSQQELQ